MYVLSHVPLNKSAWHSRCHDAVTDFEDRHIDLLRSKHARRKADASTNQGACSRFCQWIRLSHIGDHTESIEICRIESSIQMYVCMYRQCTIQLRLVKKKIQVISVWTSS